MLDLCKIFGVEEGEEFKFCEYGDIYFIQNGYLYFIDVDSIEKKSYSNIKKSCLNINDVAGKNIIKLPKKKEFTDDELCIFRLIPKEYEWCARDKSKTLFLYKNKPIKDNSFIGMWIDRNVDNSLNLKAFSHLFQSISYKDEEPIYIPDYVARD